MARICRVTAPVQIVHGEADTVVRAAFRSGGSGRRAAALPGLRRAPPADGRRASMAPVPG